MQSLTPSHREGFGMARQVPWPPPLQLVPYFSPAVLEQSPPVLFGLESHLLSQCWPSASGGLGLF